MRYKAKAKRPSSSLAKPLEKSGDEKELIQENSVQTRPLSKVGAQEVEWMDAKWLALADQALSE